VLAIQRRCLPTTHVDVAETPYHLSTTYSHLDEALNYYKEAFGTLHQALPSTHLMCLQIEQDITEVETILIN